MMWKSRKVMCVGVSFFFFKFLKNVMINFSSIERVKHMLETSFSICSSYFWNGFLRFLEWLPIKLKIRLIITMYSSPEELPRNWSDAPDMSLFRPLDRSFVFPGSSSSGASFSFHFHIFISATLFCLVKEFRFQFIIYSSLLPLVPSDFWSFLFHRWATSYITLLVGM